MGKIPNFTDSERLKTPKTDCALKVWTPGLLTLKLQGSVPPDLLRIFTADCQGNSTQMERFRNYAGIAHFYCNNLILGMTQWGTRIRNSGTVYDTMGYQNKE